MKYHANDKELETLRKRYHKLVNSPDLSEERALDVAKKCRELIFHVHNRIEYAENRRTQIVNVALGLIAGAVALFLASLLHGINSIEWVFLIRVAALSFFVTSVIILALYARQTNYAYPFVQVSKTWRWFYHYIVSKDYKPPFLAYESEGRRNEQRKLHLQDLFSYAKKTIDMSPKEELEQDLEQLFLVIVNEKYKNSQLSHLRSVLFRGLIVTMSILVATGLLILLT